jgi:hypothetical protein
MKERPCLLAACWMQDADVACLAVTYLENTVHLSTMVFRDSRPGPHQLSASWLFCRQPATLWHYPCRGLCLGMNHHPTSSSRAPAVG